MPSLQGARVLLGVTGGIAAYKSADLVRRLRDAGAQVRVVMTEAATHFVGEATFQALSGHPVRRSLWDPAAEAAMGHIELARWADLLLIAPASADLLARLAHGLADDLLSTVALASAAPLALAPAMNRQMYAHPATRANLELLRGRGALLLGPDEGEQACGDVGPGRMLEPEAIVARLCAPPLLAGRRVVITAGPTLEDLDPVRFIGNRSSGKMGYAIAAACAAAGARVTLVSGPTALPAPPGVERIGVRSAAQMLDAALRHGLDCDLFVAAAAVADYRPLSRAEQKIKRRSEQMVLELVRNPDIVATVARHARRPRFVLGFAAETNDVEANARLKLDGKGLDAVAANEVGAELAFDCDDNELLLIERDGSTRLPRAPKTELAAALVAWLAARLDRSPAGGG
jgi:phosphopantothenoylcysteine decarboxylase / phosphopantothenate---cysteine ligase